MGIDITVDGKLEERLSDYSSTEDATPLNLADLKGGTAQFTISPPDLDTTRQFHGSQVKLSDDRQGFISGTAKSGSGSGRAGIIATLTVDALTTKLNANRNMEPYWGPLGFLIIGYLQSVGISTRYVISTAKASQIVSVRGWSGNVYDHIKMMCAAYEIEMSYVSDTIVFRDVRTRVANMERLTRKQWTIDDTEATGGIDILYYKGEGGAGLLYPPGGWSPEVEIISVDAGETTEVELNLMPDDNETGRGPGVSVLSIEQPQCVDYVTRTHQSTSVYSVSGKDGKPIPAAQWLAQGGSLTVAPAEDSGALLVTVTGASGTDYAPYKIAMTAGSSSYYSSLRIRGTGVFYTRESIFMHSNLDPDDGTDLESPEIDNPFISSMEMATLRGISALAWVSEPKQRFTFSAVAINRIGSVDGVAFESFGEFDDRAGAGATMGNIDDAAALDGLVTFGDYDDNLAVVLNAEFANQAFGNIAGARMFDDGSWYRIISGTVSPGGVSGNCEVDNTFGDSDDAYPGMTMGGFDDFMAGYGYTTFGDYDARPFPAL